MKASLTLLEQFFHGRDQSGWGYSEQQIAAAEARLSVTFPKVLKEFYAMFGTCPYMNAGGNDPIPLYLEDFFIPDPSYNAPLYVPEELDFLVFSSITDVSAIDYGIRLSDLALDDPPVYFCDYGDTSWELENTSLLNFLVTTAFWQIAAGTGLDYKLTIYLGYHHPQVLPDLKCYITGLGMDSHELENLSDSYQHYRIFLRDDVLLALETELWNPSEETPSEYFNWLTAVSTNREKILEIKKIPALVWEENAGGES